jgi:hypothetical protein
VKEETQVMRDLMEIGFSMRHYVFLLNQISPVMFSSPNELSSLALAQLMPLSEFPIHYPTKQLPQVRQ